MSSVRTNKIHRVLIVDDQEIMRTTLRHLLSAQPSFEMCGEAHNGREALQKAVELAPEVILMDISMPELDGLEATRCIKEANPDIEVLIFSQFESLQAVRAAKKAGARGYLTKSDAAHHLVPALEAVCEHRPFFPESA